jgi:Trk K+ transport system NAD-binding subunit
MYNGNEYLEAQYGGFKMRGVPVNVNYRYLDEELWYLLDNSDAEALVFHSSLGDRVARVVDPQKAEIYQRLGVQTISTTVWGINRIANLLSNNELDVICDLSSSAQMVQMALPAQLAGRTVQNLTIPGEVHVVAIKRSGQTFLPTGSAGLQAGDLLYLAVQAASADRLTALLGGMPNLMRT